MLMGRNKKIGENTLDVDSEIRGKKSKKNKK